MQGDGGSGGMEETDGEDVRSETGVRDGKGRRDKKIYISKIK